MNTFKFLLLWTVVVLSAILIALATSPAQKLPAERAISSCDWMYVKAYDYAGEAEKIDWGGGLGRSGLSQSNNIKLELARMWVELYQACRMRER